jgi:hypothetical protein
MTNQSILDRIAFIFEGANCCAIATGTPVTMPCNRAVMRLLRMNISVSGAGRALGYQRPCRAKTINALGEKMPLNIASAATRPRIITLIMIPPPVTIHRCLVANTDRLVKPESNLPQGMRANSAELLLELLLQLAKERAHKFC